MNNHESRCTMKKILIALIATIFLLTSLALGAPSDSPQISGDKFAEVTGFPGNLPDGWTFSKLNNTNYETWDKTLTIIICLTFFLGVIYSFFKINGYRTLKGELKGNLEFISNAIIINEKISDSNVFKIRPCFLFSLAKIRLNILKK